MRSPSRRIINELYRKGAEVIYDKLAGLHVSGHACQRGAEDHPCPVQAQVLYPRARRAAASAKARPVWPSRWACTPKRIIIADVGKVIELHRQDLQADWDRSRRPGAWWTALGVGDVGSVVLRDRKHLAQDGMIVVVRQPLQQRTAASSPARISSPAALSM